MVGRIRSVRNWNALSENYQHRLEKAGIGRREYERGDSLKGARGHAATPEHPGQAGETNFPGYNTRRNALISSIQALKTELFESSGRFNAGRSLKNIKINPITGKPRGIKELVIIEKLLAQAIDDQLSYDEMIEGVDESVISALYYH